MPRSLDITSKPVPKLLCASSTGKSISTAELQGMNVNKARWWSSRGGTETVREEGNTAKDERKRKGHSRLKEDLRVNWKGKLVIPFVKYSLNDGLHNYSQKQH